MTAYTVVVPTTGRDSLRTLLSALEHGIGPRPAEVVLVDDRPEPGDLPLPEMSVPVRVLRTGGRGPAAARNAGWRAAGTGWIAFLDDDVRPTADWPSRLHTDLAALPDDVAASQGRIVVPAPTGGRRPTDSERDTAGLATAEWITADMAYRREVLAAVGGFDERFPRAFREDADLALRVRQAGWRLKRGLRTTLHPARHGGFFASVRAQRGNADNALMRRKFGPQWRELVGERPGRLGRHTLTTLGGAAALGFGAAGKRSAAAAAGAVWLGLTAEFALRRILPGPMTPHEIAKMAVTSVLIPPAAACHRLAGEVRVRRPRPAAKAILFDRDDTLIRDEPYNNDPKLVRPVPGAEEVLRRLRAAGVPVGVVSNQSGVARGLITPEQLAAVNARVEELLGPFGTWQVCVHAEGDGCCCRKPKPGLVTRAALALGVRPRDCVVIGDIGADIEAARAAGARAVLVPTPRTREAEVAAARRDAAVAGDLAEAVGLAMGDRAW
ncbi:HAD-IIIA family hydrolase [Amycolatopsis thermophila]|uniref:D,D-heptose 1,7-bisphosphate phosphatase n=1 Tax=Amycolatopsis thermophila TaxID=206084 RepID=A0ABU0F3X2_9PSEU|nr:HAD-IIIA family hydrolase [Amycolatopsis thermophila]MDQ0382275.1 histidinol-phosphate phosphatase family protein [Amycolatopsis thermophila]